MDNSKWVDLIELSKILDINSETLRRNCVSKKYVSRFTKKGKYKFYEIELSSLPISYQKIYNKFYDIKINDLQLVDKDLNAYSDAPNWAKRQADKGTNAKY